MLIAHTHNDRYSNPDSRDYELRIIILVVVFAVIIIFSHPRPTAGQRPPSELIMMFCPALMLSSSCLGVLYLLPI